MNREVYNQIPSSPNPQIHIDFEAEQKRKEAIEKAGLIYRREDQSIQLNPVTGKYEKMGIPIEELNNLYSKNDNSEQFNLHRNSIN